jgi:hypothetical protein
MEIHIKVDRPRWLTPPRRRATKLALAFVAALVVSVPVAWASHVFGDVPTGSAHHDDVTRIANAGITAGCNPPANTLYCPDQAVRRDQMASFLTRSAGRVAATKSLYFSGTVPVAGQGSFTDHTVGSVTIAVPGASGKTQFVALHGKLGLVTNSAFATYCTAGACTWRIKLVDTANPSVVLDDAIWRPRDDLDASTLSVHAVVAAPSGTTRTYAMNVWYEGTIATGSFTKYDFSLVAQTFPFGSGGGSALGVAAAEPAGAAASATTQP